MKLNSFKINKNAAKLLTGLINAKSLYIVMRVN